MNEKLTSSCSYIFLPLDVNKDSNTFVMIIKKCHVSSCMLYSPAAIGKNSVSLNSCKAIIFVIGISVLLFTVRHLARSILFSNSTFRYDDIHYEWGNTCTRANAMNCVFELSTISILHMQFLVCLFSSFIIERSFSLISNFI